MEPLIALSVAANVVQLVDFAVRVVSKGNQIYHSADGTLSANHDLETVTIDLLLLQAKLKQSCRLDDVSASLPEDEQRMHDLCLACDGVSQKLLERLNMAKAQGRHRRWKSLRQALKSVCSRQDIDDMSRSLMSFQTQLNMHLLVSLRSQLEAAELRDSKRFGVLAESSKAILEALKEGRTVFNESSMQQEESVAYEQVGNYLQALALLSDTSKNMAVALQQLTQSSRLGPRGGWKASDVDILEAILQSLRYPGSNDRYEGVEEVHPKTFGWIFDSPSAHSRPWDDFGAWLRAGDGIYWVTGKPASGKSTLMKFIANHSSTHQALREWAGDTPVASHSFYFWGLGKGMQKSRAGLFRSLLLDIFTANRHTLKATVPGVWNQLAGQDLQLLSRVPVSWYPWSLSELEALFKKAMDQECSARKYCFFIDGLDEFDGDTHELISFCQSLSTSPGLKLCLSSRPLLPFEEAFSKNLQLRLQDLTEQDIFKYAGDKLRNHPKSSTVSHKEPSFMNDLIADIVRISCGVFLWVKLAVKSLLEGLTNSDEVYDLRRRLHELPPELHALFAHMLERIRPNFYLEQASRLLQIVYQAEGPISPLFLSFADDEDGDVVFQTEVIPLPSAASFERKKAMSNRIKSRCLGLLEVSTCSWGDEVRYLHLTVREFLEKPDVWSKLLGHTTGTKFDATVSLLRAAIMNLKVDADCRTWSEKTFTTIELAMRYGLRSENSSGESQTRLLDELDRAATKLYEIETAVTKSARKTHWSAAMHSQEQPCANCPESFLTYAVGFGLVKYVEFKLGPHLSALTQTSKSSLFDYATFRRPASSSEAENYHPQMMAFLLRSGISPNCEYVVLLRNHQSIKTTIWRNFLHHLHRLANGGRVTFTQELPAIPIALLDISKIMLMYGADPGARVNGKSLLEILEQGFQPVPQHTLGEVRRMLSPSGPPQRKRPATAELSYSGKLQKTHHERYKRNRYHGRPLDPPSPTSSSAFNASIHGYPSQRDHSYSRAGSYFRPGRAHRSSYNERKSRADRFPRNYDRDR